jgi:hypothetical protein
VSTASTHLPTTTTAARYCRVGILEVFSDGSGAPAALYRDGFAFSCQIVNSEIRIAPVENRYGSGRRVPAKVRRMVESDYKALLAANLPEGWMAMHAAVYAA